MISRFLVRPQHGSSKIPGTDLSEERTGGSSINDDDWPRFPPFTQTRHRFAYRHADRGHPFHISSALRFRITGGTIYTSDRRQILQPLKTVPLLKNSVNSSAGTIEELMDSTCERIPNSRFSRKKISVPPTMPLRNPPETQQPAALLNRAPPRVVASRDGDFPGAPV